MKNNVKLSVIVPVFNCEEYLQRCLESLINQSFKNIQIIIVNDASTDKTNEVINEFKNNNENILAITNERNKGAGLSRNIGLNYTNSEYITFLDADDWIDTNTYQKMIYALDETKADIAICGIKTEYPSSYCSTNRYTYINENTINGKFALHLLIDLENRDGSNTVYLFSEPISYTDENGNLKTKDISVEKQTDKALKSNGYEYTNGQNDYRINFSSDSSKGLYIEFGESSYTIIPQSDKAAVGNESTSEILSEQFEDFEYPNIYGEGTNLKFYPQLNGVKDEIVLNSNIGQNVLGS